LRSEFGSKVLLGAQERPTLERYDLDDGVYPIQVQRLIQCGATALAGQVAAMVITDADRAVDFSFPDFWLNDGEKVRTPQRTLEVFTTPGHTRGHIVLRDSDAGVLFSGDHILPHITPSLGLERAPELTPLRSYLDSLRLIREQPDLLLLPAHGSVSPSTHVRIDELVHNHEQRLALIADLVRTGHATAFDVASRMQWTRRRSALIDMGVEHQMTAVLEVQAHLDILSEVGEVTEFKMPDGVRRHHGR
jgi:glyoxylase-like metal-dependent hydrolase (beta-lactamase superfamily II)